MYWAFENLISLLIAHSSLLTAQSMGFAAYYPYFYAPKRAIEYDH
ncbi:hypothetical protein BC659_2028 [Sediminibacterium goheungense]|uniref:Uncharacterized protein n=1 Tax=Sediminibacterium goheungense TaxID=1086393 RepID=A0A4R6IVM1_9BACT|nr:hypothetical protein BC659_2028 [Sediminibacterium goheungense]